MLAAAQEPVTHFFTVDVEEHFQVNAFEGVVRRAEWDRHPSRVEQNVDVLLELLANHDVLATFFVLGWVAARHPHLVRRLSDSGHEVASHGFHHRRVPTMSPAEFRDDIRGAKAVLEEAAGRAVIGFRAPSFSIIPGCEWAYDVLLEEGYEYDSSVFPIRRPGYGNPHAPTEPYFIDRAGGRLREFPLATLSLGPLRLPAAGGGYLRQFPLQLIEAAFRQQTGRGVPGVFYVHPWELDPDQPRLPVRFVTRLRHYRGLAGARDRVDRLLGQFRFSSIARGAPATERVPA